MILQIQQLRMVKDVYDEWVILDRKKIFDHVILAGVYKIKNSIYT